MREAERCTACGAIGALVRREGVYASYLSTRRASAGVHPRRTRGGPVWRSWNARPCACRARPRPPLALRAPEEQAVLEALHSERFMDQSPPEVDATLLDEQGSHCSARTMYRVLARQDELRERRRQLVRPVAVQPELLATAPNQVWSWDITTLRGPAKWTSFSLYVLLDIFSRSVVGWLIAEHESAAVARRLIAHSGVQQGIERDQLTGHSD
ncbi:MAG: DDE-type integrase/transposase/recombinase, partial [Candidatus Binatia bacterium]